LRFDGCADVNDITITPCLRKLTDERGIIEMGLHPVKLLAQSKS
jgi:hypothetical protein